MLIGLTQQVIASIKAALDYIPDPDHTNIGIVTYSNTTQFFSCSPTSSEPTVVVMSDVITPFSPLPKSKLLFNVRTGRAQIDAILDKISALYDYSTKAKTQFTSAGSCGGAAVKAAVDLLAPESGKVLWFIMDIPSVGYGALKSRNNPQLYNSDKEKSLYTPDDKATAYIDIGAICFSNKVAVDIYACPQGDLDLPSLLPISAHVGGEVQYYSPFNSVEYI